MKTRPPRKASLKAGAPSSDTGFPLAASALKKLTKAVASAVGQPSMCAIVAADS